MRWASAAVVLPLALACCKDEGINPVPGPAIGYASGSRLRARVRSGSPGARLLVGWHDAKLGADCTFVTTADGETRCAPSGATIFYLDQLCSQPIAVVSADCSASGPPPFASAVSQSDVACNGITQAYRVGDPIDVPSPTRKVYVGAGASGGCLRSTHLDPTAQAYAVLAIAPTELAKATLTRAPKTDRLGLEVLVGDDGARQARGLYDIATRGRCFSIAGAIGGGEDRCIPDDLAWATYAADSTCSAPIAYQVRPTASCPGASVVVGYGFQGCDVRATYFTPGAPVSIDDVFSGAPPVCTLLRAQTSLYEDLLRDHVFYEVGAPVAAATFAPMKAQTTGFGRLQVPVLAAADGTELAPARPDTFFDTTLGVPCRAYVFPDGTKRCVPRDAVAIATTSYADDACTAEIVGLPSQPGCATVTSPGYAVRVSGSACVADITATSVVALGDVQTLAAYYTKSDTGACTRQAQGGSFASIAGEVPPASFAIVVETLE
jgi:hypothetical protein